MADTTVKYFSSTMSGAPALSGTAGALIGVLDACLVNGFGSVTLDSLVIASNVATGTVSGGHNFEMVGNTGPVITIEGATPAGLNGEWRMASVPGSTTFTFATTGISDQTATGTITTKRAPAGFSKAYSGTNKAAYRANAIAGTRLYLRMDDSTTTSARMRGYETMSDVDTGTGPFPTDAQLSGGAYTAKSNAANSTARAWFLLSDGQMIYCMCDATGSWANGTGGFIFGDLISYKTPDAYAAIMAASSSNTNSDAHRLNNTASSWMARSYTQIGGSVLQMRRSHSATSSLGHAATGVNQFFPNMADNNLHVWPVDCWEYVSSYVGIARGLMPGLWNPLHQSEPSHLLTFDNISQLPGRTLLCLYAWNNSYRALFDLTGPWR